jgi:hypothetical protein
MPTKKEGLLRGILRKMTSRMSRSRRVQPSSMLPTGIIEEELSQRTRRQSRRQSRGQSRAKTPAQREAERKEKAAERAEMTRIRARIRASRPKVPSPEAQEVIRQHHEVLATIAHYSKEMERLKTESNAMALEAMEEVEEAKAMLDKIKEKKGGKKSRTHRKPKRARK